MQVSRRRLLVGMGGAVVLLAGGCASQDRRSPDEPRTYCLRTGRFRRRVCMPTQIPPAAAEADAKTFQPRPGVLTVYIVRWEWLDNARRLDVKVDGDMTFATMPRTMVRLALPPGRHFCSLEWNGRTEVHTVNGFGGEVQFVELAGSATPFAEGYHWSSLDPVGARARALRSTLVADLAYEA